MRRIAIVMLGVLAVSICASAGSIWDKAQARTQILYADDTARAVGDSITILIEEKSTIENETKRDMNKESNRKIDISGSVTHNGDRDTLPDVKFNSAASTDFTGNAKFDSSRKVIDSVTVTVQDVLPNGNLVVLGTRIREVAGDREIIQISGVVRTSDIKFDNSVNSSRVANFQVVYQHKGQENNFTRPGWLDRILNKINPF